MIELLFTEVGQSRKQPHLTLSHECMKIAYSILVILDVISISL